MRGRTDRALARYNRNSGIYDFMELPMERSFGPWRNLLWSKVMERVDNLMSSIVKLIVARPGK